MGAVIESEDGHAPLTINPASLSGIRYRLPVASAQVKSAVLLAALYARGATRVRQPGPARDHTERMLAAMGVPLRAGRHWVRLPAGKRRLRPLQMVVPGDISSAAFPLVAATLLPGSAIRVEGVGVNPTRTGILELLANMGASVSVEAERESGGEPVADLTARFDELHHICIRRRGRARHRQFPIWAVAASQAAGAAPCAMRSELRVRSGPYRRSGRRAAPLGIPIAETASGFTIHGPVRPRGGTVSNHGDHRLGMALAVAGLMATGPVRVLDADCVSDSFPGFVETMQALAPA